MHHANVVYFLLTMNPLNLSFDEKVKLLFSTNSLPVGDGVEFVEFKILKLHQIVQRTDTGSLNIVRAEGCDPEIISRFAEHIKNGVYTFTFQQPVVCAIHGEGIGEELYELVCGEHRYQAHAGTGQDSMLVAVVKFKDLESKLIFQSNENDPEDVYIKNPRTMNDVILTLTGLVNEGIIDINDDKSINSRLIKLNQKTNDFPLIRERLREEYGISNPVTSFDDVKRAQWCAKHQPQITFSSRSKIVPVDGIAYLSKTFKGGSGSGGVRDLDYDPRCFFDICHLLQQNNVQMVNVVASVNNSTSSKIEKIRDYKREKLMQEWMDKCISIVDDYRAGKIDPVRTTRFDFVPQINNVDDMEEFS
jgi:hypothetical protein